MKTKNFLSKLFIALFLLTGISVSSCNTVSQPAAVMVNGFEIPQLIDRTGQLAKASEWENTKLKVAELTQKIKDHPEDVKPRLQLATIYMSEARITGDIYYHQATMTILDGVIKLEPQNFEAYTYKASVAMSLHQFQEAKDLAEKAQQLNPNNAYVCGVLVDANVELGNYEKAVEMSDKMQTLKPSLEAYARVSYLREIYGDYPGAIDAMKMAVKAGTTGSESAEWARVALGDLFLNTGQLDSAEIAYNASLVVRPEFPNAEIGLAKAAKARKNYDSAIAHVERAINIVSEASYVAMLGELYTLKGDNEKAGEINKQVIAELEKAEEDQLTSKGIKHNANRELSRAYLSDRDLEKALKYAQIDLAIRPENIDANELVAWIYYLKGDYSNAKIHADKMLQTNTMNATTLYKAGLIYTKAGDLVKADMCNLKASQVNSTVDQKLMLALN